MSDITKEQIATCEAVLNHIAKANGISFNLVDYYELLMRTTNPLKWFHGENCSVSMNGASKKEKAAKLAAELLADGFRLEHYSTTYYLKECYHENYLYWTVEKKEYREEPVVIISTASFCRDRKEACYKFAEWLESNVRL